MKKLFILLSALLLTASGGMAQTTINVPGDYGTIQAAIDAADPNDVISVSEGVYDEVLLIDKQISLLGPNSAISAVDGIRVPEARLLQRINISHDENVTVSGFEFFEVPTTSTWTIYIYGNSNNFTFENNRFIDITTDAVRSGISSSTGNITVKGNLIEGITAPLASGILLGGIYGTSTIMDNKIDLAFNGSPSGYSGIQTPSATGLTISGNEISNTTNQGIQLAGACGDVAIENNSISNANTSEGSDKGAIRLYGTDFTGTITISGNILTNSYSGIAVKNGQDISGKDIAITENSITNLTGGYAIYNGGTGTLSATCNWHGTADPLTITNGIQGDVNFEPFLSAGGDSGSSAPGFDPLADCNGCAGGNVTNTNQNTVYCSIQAALDAANDGENIEVSEGTYSGALVILNNNITLTSTGQPENTIIDAGGSTNAIAIGEFSDTGTHPTGVTLDGFTVKGWLERGISQRNGAGAHSILNNIVVGPAPGESSFVRGGISVSGGASLIKGNTLTVPEFGSPDWSSGAILLLGNIGAIVEENQITGIPNIGISVSGYFGNVDPEWASASNVIIRDNDVDGVSDGIVIAGNVDNTLITGNSITNCTNSGVYQYLETAGGNNEAPSNTTVTKNNFTGSPTAIGNAGGDQISATCNWYGSIDPDFSTFIDGDVNYTPWLVTDDLTSTTNCTGAAVTVFESDGTTFVSGHSTIQGAIDDILTLDGYVIEVSAGTYNENVEVNKPLSLLGANADVSCGNRDSESIIAPSSGLPIHVTSDGATINGFEITAPDYQYAINCGNTSNLTISYNNIHDIGTTITNTNVHSIVYTVAAAASTSNVNILDNCFNYISSTNLTGNSASAIGVLQSTSTGVLTGLNIERNTINEVNVNTGNWPTGKIAYGIQINTGGGGSYLTTNGKVVDAVISQNEITNLSGFISTGIGLEGNTENVIVENNYVANLAGNKEDTRSEGGYDLQALKFENNRYVGTASVQNNSFEAGTFTHGDPQGVGYAVVNYVPVGGSYSGGTTAALELGCNWYGTAVFSEIEDNATLTGRILNKDDCETTFVPYLIDGTDDESGTIGFQPVSGSCEGYPEGTVFVLDSGGEIVNFFYGNDAIVNAIASAGDDETVLIASGEYDEAIDASGAPDPSLSISIGESPGCVTVTGLTLTSNDTWLEEMADYEPCTGYDQLTVNGNVDLGGATLDAQLLGGFVPAPGWEFEIIEYSGTLTGQFDEGTSITIDGQSFLIDYGTGTNSVVKLIPQGYANYVWYDDQGNAYDGGAIDIDVEACQEVTVVVKLETEGPITTTELKLNFDPNHLQVVSIDGLDIFDEDDAIAGDLFGVGSPSYDNNTGEISYATTSIAGFNTNSVSVSENYMTITFSAERNDSENGDGTLTEDNTTYTTSIEAVDIGVLGGTRIMNVFGFVPEAVEPLSANVMLDAETLDVNITPDITEPVINGDGICLSLDDSRYINVPGESLYEVDGTEFDVITSATDDCTTPTITHNASSISGADGTGASSAASLDGWQFPVGSNTITFTASDGFNTVTCDVEITVEYQTLTGSATINMGCNDGADVEIIIYDNTENQVAGTFTTTVVQSTPTLGDFASPIGLTGVPAGTHEVFVKIDRYLAKGYTVPMSDPNAQPNVALSQVIPGDIAGNPGLFSLIDNDNIINGLDLSLIIGDYNTISSNPPFNDRSDLNCDDQVDAIDLSFVSFYYFTQGDSPQ